MTQKETQEVSTSDHFSFDPWMKQLFQDKSTVLDLLSGDFLDLQWFDVLDVKRLRSRPTNVVKSNLQQSHMDLVWEAQVKIGGKTKTGYVVILLEQQRTVNTYMSIRMMEYLAVTYQYLVHVEKVRAPLPEMYPVVVYNGESKWTAPLCSRDLIDAEQVEGSSPSLVFHALQNYVLLDLQHHQSVAKPNNLVWAWGEFEKALAAKLLRPIAQAYKLFFKLVIKTDNQLLIGSTQNMLKWRLERPLAEVFKEVVDMEDMDMETKLQTLESFKEEVREEGREEGRVEGREEGRQEGREEGRQEGREEGQRTALDQMARLKFGASVLDELMEVKNSEQLGQVSGWIFECETAEELEGRIKSLCTA